MKLQALLTAMVAGLLTAFAAPQSAQAAWFGWESLGGAILEEPECVSWGSNRIDCFARGTDSAMYHRWWNGSSWGGWENLGGIILEEPKCVSWGPNRIDCFARGTDAAMYHRWWNGSSWGGWENLGGAILEAPECVSWGPNRIDCFARGTDAAMYHRWWNGSSWGGWENLGGVILERPECVSWGPNRIDCFARGTNRAMFHRWWNGSSWGGWENLGGIILERPECVAWGSNRIDCFARGTDAAMYHRWWNGSSWGGWENLGGVILEQPECVSWSANRLDCFARGTDRAMYHRWWNGSAWGGWENLGGIILEQPSCVSWGPERLDCFARGTNRAMFHRWFTPTQSRAITVSRRNSVTLTDAQVDSLLADGSAALQADDGNGDVACNVSIVRSGAVGQFTNGDGSIDTQAELSEIFGLAGNVKVVDDVNWCANQFNSSYIGCGQTPGTSFITERFTANQEGILWTHEFGHNQGLPHRDTSTNNVMYFSIGTNRRNVNQTECNAYRGSSPAVAATPEENAQMAAMAEADTMPGGGITDSDAASNSPDGTLPPVAEFVSQIYFDGLPLDKAASYTEADADILLSMLNDASQAQFHENIALTLGMIGSQRSVEPLIAYLKSGPAANAKGEEGASRPVHRGRIGAIMALGYIVNSSGDRQALDYLKESTSPAVWSTRGLTGLSVTEEALAKLPEDLSKYAIFSLGLSGNAEAAEHLRKLAGAQDGTETQQKFGDEIAQSLELSAEVARKGLIEYYRKAE
jgi:hypothetical protein